MHYDGRCSCGAIRYRMKREPLIVNACHCLDCQRITGGAFVINAIIEASNLELLSGEPASFDLREYSGKEHLVYFCAACGTYVWSAYAKRSKSLRMVRVGTLEDPTALSPAAHVFTKSKQPWLQLPPGVPVFDQSYDPHDGTWPAESLRRLQAVIDAEDP